MATGRLKAHIEAQGEEANWELREIAKQSSGVHFWGAEGRLLRRAEGRRSAGARI